MENTNGLRILLFLFIICESPHVIELVYFFTGIELTESAQVDVRDVASATVASMTTPSASGRRILLVADTITP